MSTKFKVWITVLDTPYCFYVFLIHVQMTVPDPRTLQPARSEWPHGHECLRAHNARWPRRMAFSPSPLARRALRITSHSNMYSNRERSNHHALTVNECWHTRTDNDLLLLSPVATSSASSATSHYLPARSSTDGRVVKLSLNSELEQIKKPNPSRHMKLSALGHENIGGIVDIAPRFLTSELDGGDWSVSRSGCFTPSTYWIGGWMGPRAGLNSLE
jgi:hypothetical protein